MPASKKLGLPANSMSWLDTGRFAAMRFARNQSTRSCKMKSPEKERALTGSRAVLMWASADYLIVDSAAGCGQLTCGAAKLIAFIDFATARRMGALVCFIAGHGLLLLILM